MKMKMKDDHVEEGEIEIERETTHIGCQYAEPVDAMSDQAYNTWFTANWAVDSPLPPLLWQTRSVEHILLRQILLLFHHQKHRQPNDLYLDPLKS